ncbi:hypothetical protein KEM54_004632, partial [Ascosphaera aggregata]
YSAGRDGTICSWDLHLPSKSTPVPETPDGDDSLDVDADPFSDSHRIADSHPAQPEQSTQSAQSTTLRHQFQAHTHWINDIELVDNKSQLVSASSDTSVRVWPTTSSSDSDLAPETLGRHGDYVKCLSSPEPSSSWIASGGLDRKIFLWDLNGNGEILKLELNDDYIGAKGSVYALAARPQVVASGGPENVVRVWDPRSGKPVTKLIGHTNNIRDILINQSGDTIISASSDQTVKVWSLTAGRCLHTLTMHNDSVWSLYSDHPQLSVLYSADRSGLAMKTDTRRAETFDQGLCIALLQEHEGIQKVIADGGYVWTATQRSSIQRWDDIDTTMEVEQPQSTAPTPLTGDALAAQDQAVPHLPVPSSGKAEVDSDASKSKDSSESEDEKEDKKKPLTKIPRSAIAPLTITSSFAHNNILEDSFAAPPLGEDESDLSVPIQIVPNETIEGQYGLIKHTVLNDRRHALTQDTAGEVVMWDLLQCVPVKSFGKRHLDDVLNETNTDDTMAPWCTLDTRTGHLTVSLDANRCFDAEVYADEAGLDDCSQFKEDQRLNYGKWLLRHLFSGLIDEERKRDEAYRQTLQVPSRSSAEGIEPPSPRAVVFPQTPLDSPFMHPLNVNAQDYFSTSQTSQTNTNPGTAPSEHDASASTTSDNPPDTKEEKPTTKRSGSIFGKNLKLSLSSKKPKQQEKQPAADAKPIAEEKTDEQLEKAEDKEPEYEDTLKGVIDKIRAEYEVALSEKPTQRPISKITPSTEKETPTLAIPSRTAVMIREEISDAVVAADLYRGTVESMANDADKLERVVPTWLGELLLRNVQPYKEIQKLTFTLKPFDDTLPPVVKADPNKKAVDNSRLNANRMLRAKKILAYIAERIDPADPKNPNANPYKPEEYLELHCQNIHIPPNMTLYAIRTHIWRSGSDMVLYYKSNGKRTIPVPDAQSDDGTEQTGAATGVATGTNPTASTNGAMSATNSAVPSLRATS